MTFLAAGCFLFSLSGLLLSMIPTSGSHRTVFIKYFQGLFLLPLLIGPIELISEKCISKSLSILSFSSSNQIYQTGNPNLSPYSAEVVQSSSSSSSFMDSSFSDSNKEEEVIYNELVNLRTTTESNDPHDVSDSPQNNDHPHVLLRFRQTDSSSSSSFSSYFTPSTIAVVGIRTAFAILINILLSCFISAGIIEETFKLVIGMHGLRGESALLNKFLSQFNDAKSFFPFNKGTNSSQLRKKRHYHYPSSPTQSAVSNGFVEKKSNDFSSPDTINTDHDIYGFHREEESEANALIILTGVAACSLGFATTETLGFVWIFQGSTKQRLLFVLGRVMFSFPLHISCSVMGASRFLAISNVSFWKRVFKALIPSIALHGSYDAGSLLIHTLSKTQILDPETNKNVDIIPSHWVSLFTAIWCTFIFSISIYCGYYAWVYHKFEATISQSDEGYDYLLPSSDSMALASESNVSRNPWILEKDANHMSNDQDDESRSLSLKNMTHAQVV